MGKTGIDLRRMNPEKFRKETSTAILYNRFHSDKEGLMRIGFAADWSFDIYLNGTHCLKAQGPTPLNADSNFHKFHIRKGENILVAVVRAGSRGWGFLCAEPRDPVVFREGKNWKAYRSSNLEIIPGSALDLSAQNDAPAGKYGPAVLSPDGRVVFENAPEQPVRLLGFNTFAINGIMARPKPLSGDLHRRRNARATICSAHSLSTAGLFLIQSRNISSIRSIWTARIS